MNDNLSVALKISSFTEKILKEMGVENPVVELSHPEDLNLGDYTLNSALKYSKDLKEKPFVLAEKIVKKLNDFAIAHIEKISIAGPGFINIFLDRTFFSESIKNQISAGAVTLDVEVGANKLVTKTEKFDKKIIIEYTNTNVLKPLHIGHLMGNVIGESLSRILEYCGHNIKRNTYQGDVGLHIAKAVWGIMDLRKNKSELENGKDGQVSEADFIGKAYAHGAAAYDDSPKHAEEIKEINKKVFEKSDKEINSIYEWGRKISLEHFEELYKKLGTKFDYYFFESEVAESAVKIVKEYLKKGIFEESDGAIVFRGENFDPSLHTRVFINSQGLPTYDAKEIAHAERKYRTWNFDKSIIITANEQNDYFRVVLRALKEIDSELASKISHLSHGMLKLTTGKMGSRKGNVITGESLINEVTSMVHEKVSNKELSDLNSISNDIAVGAIKYSILKQAPGSDIIYDPEKAISFEGDSGPYLQYSKVRATSLLKKATDADKMIKVGVVPNEVTKIERLLYRFNESVIRSAVTLAPNHLVTYLTMLAAEFNSWYGNTKIIEDNNPYTPWRLAIVKNFEMVMEKGLYLLGINCPKEM